MRSLNILTLFSAVRCNEITVGGVGLKDTTGMRWETSGCVRNALWAMTEKMKFFVTPNFPMKYPDSVTCTWKMRTTGAKKIKIDWQVFWMDGCNDGNQVIVHDPKANKRLGPYCGMKKPPSYISKGNQLEITLKKGKTPHPQNGRGVQFMVGFLAVGGNAKTGTSKAPKNRKTGAGRMGAGTRPVLKSAAGPATPKRPLLPPPSKDGKVNVSHLMVSKNGHVTYKRPVIPTETEPSGDIRTAPNSGAKAAGPAGKNGSPGGMVDGVCTDPPDMGCNNKNWKPHEGTHSSSPIDLKNAPDGYNKINMTELAKWISGEIAEKPTPASGLKSSMNQAPTFAPATTIMNPVRPDVDNLWKSKRSRPNGLAIVYGAGFDVVNGSKTHDYFEGYDEALYDYEESFDNKDMIRTLLPFLGGIFVLLSLLAIGVRLCIFADKTKRQSRTTSQQRFISQ